MRKWIPPSWKLYSLDLALVHNPGTEIIRRWPKADPPTLDVPIVFRAVRPKRKGRAAKRRAKR